MKDPIRTHIKNSNEFKLAMSRLYIEYPRGYKVLMMHLEEKSREDMMKVMKVSSKAVTDCLSRAKLKLLEFLEDSHSDFPED